MQLNIFESLPFKPRVIAEIDPSPNTARIFATLEKVSDDTFRLVRTCAYGRATKTPQTKNTCNVRQNCRTFMLNNQPFKLEQ